MKNIIHLINMKLSTQKMQFTIRTVAFLLLFAAATQQSQAQCTGCTQSVSVNTANITVAAGQVVCITYAGTFTKTITFNGGTLCISPATTVSSAITVPSGGSLNVYGKVSGAFTNNGGTVTVYSAGIFNPSSTSFNSGTTTVNSGGSATFASNVSISAGSLINNGTMTFSNNLTNNGGTITLAGTETFGGTVTNNNAAAVTSISGPATIGSSLVVNSGIVNLSGGITESNNVTNYGAINLSGSLSIGGNYTATGSLTASASGCNSMTVSGSINSNNGSTYNGNNYSLAISPSTGCTSCMSNGAFSAPTSQPTSLSASISGATVSGSFTAASASVADYLVLRYVGTSAPSSSPVNGTSYSVGSTVGTCTVAAIVTGGTTGTLSFTDNITASSGNCGKNVYYRIFSYNGSGTCDQFYTSSPLTGSVAIAASAASVTASGATTFCSGSNVTLTASAGSSYAWSTAATTQAITASTAATYTVTVTNAMGCTATASSTVSVYSNPTLSTWSNTPVCVGSTAMMSVTPSGSTSYTYSWNGPSSFTSAVASPTVANATTVNSGNYNITVTDNHSCTVSTVVAMYINPNCIDSTTTGANGGNSSDAPCTQILRFDHYNDVVASQAGGQSQKWVLKNGNILSMTVTRTAGSFNAVAAPTWSGAGFGQSGYTGLGGDPVLYTAASGYSKVVFSNISLKDSNGLAVNNYTLIGIDAESTDGAERDTLTTNGTAWFDYDTITPPNIGSVPSETGINTGTLVWTGTGSANARARLVSTNNPTTITFSTVAGGLQGFALGISNPVQAITATTICSNSSFNATPTNMPAGTTYTWSAPVVAPAGSLTGANAQASAVAVVGQTLVNTTSSPATAVYSVIPSNNCSGLGYTVTVTINPAPSASITTNAPVCVGNALTATATAVTGGPQTYSWSGPASYTANAATFNIATTTLSNSGSYTVTITGSNSCTASMTSSLSVVNCLNVTGNIFDDANGNGILDGTEVKTDYSQTLYTVIADTTGAVISTSAVAADGSFSLNNVLPNKSGMTVRVSTSAPAVGSIVAAASWPSNWLGTLGSYGTNNAAGTGVYNNASELIPVRTTTVNVTGMYIGFDRVQAATSQSYTITHPALNSVTTLSPSTGLGYITWSDPEDGANKGSFVIQSITAMHNNVLFYDSNNNNIAETSEIITGYKVIANFNDAKLKIKFTATGTYSAGFSFGYIDAAGKSNPTASTYTVNWTGGALPVTLEYFTAEKADAHSSLLQWATGTEIDNDHFDIERSSDALSWEKIGEKKGAGTTSEQQLYSYTDEAPLNGVNYYRLKQVDVDGHFVYTDIQQVSFDGLGSANTMTMYPNPAVASTPLTIELSNSSSVISNVTITNSIGQIVYSDISSSSNVLHLSGLNLHAGVYAVSVSTEGAKAITSLLVIK